MSKRKSKPPPKPVAERLATLDEQVATVRAAIRAARTRGDEKEAERRRQALRLLLQRRHGLNPGGGGFSSWASIYNVAATTPCRQD
jgi:hypothetical protein